MTVTIKHEGCIKCGGCASVCPFGALELVGDKIRFYPEKCKYCGLCAKICPANVIVVTKDSVSVAGKKLKRGLNDVGIHPNSSEK